MKQENIALLEGQRPLVDQLIKSGCARNINLQGLVNVMKSEFEHEAEINYDAPWESKFGVTGCLIRLYNYFDQWKANQ